MSIFAFKNHWIKACTGIELHVLPDNSFSCRYCSASLKGQLLTIDTRGEESGSLSSIAQKIPADKPLSITITGKGVLIKKISVSGAQNMSSVFPNFKTADFYELSYSSGDSRYIAIIRKEIADRILSVFNAEERRVLSFTLGPFAVSHILPQLNLYGEQAQFDGHIITIKDSNWISYQYQEGALAEFPVKIEMEVISERLILAYASAFQLCLSHLLEPVQATAGDTPAAYEEFIEQKKFQYRSVILLSLLFVVLLFNFLIFNYFNLQNEELLSQVNVSSNIIRNSESSLQDLKAKEVQVKALGWHKGIRLSSILDQVGQTVPAGIRLTLIKTGSENNSIDKIINIQGAAKELKTVNNWMYLLQEKEWIEKVTLENFHPAENSEEQIFNLTLKY